MFTRTLKVPFKNKQHEVVLLQKRANYALVIGSGVTSNSVPFCEVSLHGLINDQIIDDVVKLSSVKNARSFIKNFTADMAKDFLQDQYDSLSIENKPKTEK